MILLSLGKLQLESGEWRGVYKCVSEIISRLIEQIFSPSISHSTKAVFKPWVSVISVFITKIIHTTVKVTCWNVTDTPLETATEKYSPLKEENWWHKSCIVHNSLVSCTIPLYCVFIIPLNWIYGVSQVEHSHAWTFFTVCFVEWVQKRSNHWYSWHSQCEVWQHFLWIYECMVIPEQPQTSTAVSAWGRGSLFPSLQDKEPLTPKP